MCRTKQRGQPATLSGIGEQKDDIMRLQLLLDQLQMLRRLGAQRLAYGMAGHGYFQYIAIGHGAGINLEQMRGSCGCLHAIASDCVRVRVEALAHRIRVAHLAAVQQRDVLEAPGLRE